MSTIVTEAELQTVDLGGYCEVLLICDREDEVGVLAYEFRHLAPLSGQSANGAPVANQLKVLVEGEVSAEALARVVATLNARTGRPMAAD